MNNMNKEIVEVYKKFSRCIDCPFCSIRVLDGKPLNESENMTLECLLTSEPISSYEGIKIPEDCPLRWMGIARIS